MSKVVPSCVVKLTFTLPGVAKWQAEASNGVNEEVRDDVLALLQREYDKQDEASGKSEAARCELICAEYLLHMCSVDSLQLNICLIFFA